MLALRADELTAPDRPDKSFRRFVVELPGAVMILAVDDDERVVLLRQYRHPAQSRLVEMPGRAARRTGGGPGGRSPARAARGDRSRCVAWRHLVTVLPSPGISEECHVIYLAAG